MSARIIPVNAHRFILSDRTYMPEVFDLPENREQLPKQIADDLAALKERVKAISPGGIGVTFDAPSPFEPCDMLGLYKSVFADDPLVAYYRTNNTANWELLENKILEQAARLAITLAITRAAEGLIGTDLTEGVPGPLTHVNAANELAMAYRLVGMAHLTNVAHEVKLTEMRERCDKLVETIRRHGSVTKSMLCDNHDMTPRDIAPYLEMLVDAGRICSRKAGRGVRYALAPES